MGVWIHSARKHRDAFSRDKECVCTEALQVHGSEHLEGWEQHFLHDEDAVQAPAKKSGLEDDELGWGIG